MTPSQLEHLKFIDAHCERKLKQAEHIPHYSESAEAGWKSTRSLIDYLLMMYKHGEGDRYIGLAEDLRAAFPLELIQKP